MPVPLESKGATLISRASPLMPLESTPISVKAGPALLPEPPAPARATGSAGDDSIEEAEILQASIKAGSAAQIVVAVIAVIGLVYLLKVVMVTTLFSILLAFVLEPPHSGQNIDDDSQFHCG